MNGIVCDKCHCYITPPNPCPTDLIPKMCECKSRQELLLEEILREVKEIKRYMEI
jgi:hypothetical protein